MQSVIMASQVAKSYGRQKVLSDLSFSAEKGEIAAIMGANGAGKTTLLRILATLTRPEYGFISYFGLSLKGNEQAIRKQLGVVLHSPMLYYDLTAEENLSFFARLYGIGNAKERLEEVFDQIDLCKRRNQTVRSMSRGMQQRLAIGRALLNRPEVLFLDEPFSGLDLDSVERLEKIISKTSDQGGTVVFISHDFERVTRLAAKTWVLHQGKLSTPIIMDGIPASQLQMQYQTLIGNSE